MDNAITISKATKIRDFINVGAHVLTIIFASLSAIKLAARGNTDASFWAWGVVIWCTLDFVNNIAYTRFRNTSIKLIEDLFSALKRFEENGKK